MCRDITREQQIEGWRAFIDLLRGLKPNIGGILAALKDGRRSGSAPSATAINDQLRSHP